MFWGLLFLTIGFIMILNYTLGANLPLVRIVFSVGIIYVGFKMLFGSFGVDMQRVSNSNQAIFSKGTFSWNDEKKNKGYDTVFGDSVLDLRDVSFENGGKEIEMNTVFGKTEVILKEGTPFIIESEAVFGSVKMPERKLSGFGENTYSSANFDINQPHIRLKTAAVFGEVEIRFVN